jgi:CubicO group peptidase (beta-lactamase class C family)
MRRPTPLLFGLLVLLAPLVVRAQVVPADPALSARVREAMRGFVESGEVAGIVALVGDRDRVLVLEANGQARLEENQPMRPDTLFRIASMTKPITAIAVMMLKDDGKLGLDDPVETHLPEFRGQMLVASRSGDTMTLTKPPRPITLRDLLTHTSGLPGAPPLGLADLYRTRQRTLAEGVLTYSQRPLDFLPGTKWAYCNTGIDTLGRVVEVVSGQSYEAFLQDRLFGPLNMADTTFYPSPEQLRRAAVTYNRENGALTPAISTIIGPPEGAKYPIPAGGLYSTALDLAQLYQMMLHKGQRGGRRYLSESAVAEMTSLQTGELKTGFVEGMGFGLGWAVVREPNGVTARLSPGSFGHGGAFGTQGWIDPVRGRFVVLMIQRVGLPNADASDMRRELQRVAFEVP